MGKFCSVFVATVQYVLSIYVFKRPDLTGCGPLISALTVLLAVFFLLWSLPLYPRRLRKLMAVGNCLMQYIIAVFLIEYIMGCFWFPLEAAVLALLPKTASFMEDSLQNYDYHCYFPCEFLRHEATGAVLSFLLSVLLLLAALHATRIINLRLLSSGFTPFANDVTRRFRRFYNNFPVNIGIPNYFIKRRRSRKPDYCTTDDDPYDSMEPVENSEYQYVYR